MDTGLVKTALPDPIQDPGCDYPWTAKLTLSGGGALPSFITYDPVKHEYWVDSQSYSEIGVYTLQLSVTYDNHPAGFPNGPYNLPTWTLEVQDPCVTTSIAY